MKIVSRLSKNEETVITVALQKFVIYGLISSEITYLIWFIFSHFISI